MKKIAAASVLLLIILAGCAQQETGSPAPLQQAATPAVSAAVESTPTPTITEVPASSKQPEIIGPGGCKTQGECDSYCAQRQGDCSAWCLANSVACAKLGIQQQPAGVPGSPCAASSECYSGLVCVDYKCDIPSPENQAKASGSALPGNCKTMQECASYCEKPENDGECTDFCVEFPSFCSSARVQAAPPECKECASCNEKSCILGCLKTCHSYVPLAPENPDELAAGFSFERKYQSPVKGVWEPGPAFNRVGATFFADEYKALGVNTYSIIPRYDHTSDKKLIHSVDRLKGEAADNETVSNLIKAKKAGLQAVVIAHDLYDLFPDANPDKAEKIRAEDYSAQLEELALKWANVAEQYKAEYFVPINEFEYVLYENGYSAEEACAKTNELYQKVIPKVRETFKGKIYCRFGGMDAKFSCMDVSLCDLFGFTYGFRGEDYPSNFRALFEAGESLSKKYGKPYVMAEAFSFNSAGFDGCARLHRAGIEEYKKIAGNGAGYFFMGLIEDDPIRKNSCALRGTPLEDDYRQFFEWLDSQ